MPFSITSAGKLLFMVSKLILGRVLGGEWRIVYKIIPKQLKTCACLVLGGKAFIHRNEARHEGKESIHCLMSRARRDLAI